MVEKPKRPILHLKFPPATPPGLPQPPPRVPVPTPFARKPAMRAAPPKPPAWKCKPCGKAFDVPTTLPDGEDMRCPSCNARLGLAGDFRGEEPNIAKLRARQIAPR